MSHGEFEMRWAAATHTTVARMNADGIWSRRCHCGCGGFFMFRGALAPAPDGATAQIYYSEPLIESHPSGLPRNRSGA